MKRLARLVVLLAAVWGGWYYLEARHRTVDIVYDVAVPDATALLVQIGDGARIVRRTEFRRPAGQVRHRVRLADGRYQLAWTLEGSGGVLRGERTLDVDAEQTVVLRLGP